MAPVVYAASRKRISYENAWLKCRAFLLRRYAEYYKLRHDAPEAMVDCNLGALGARGLGPGTAMTLAKRTLSRAIHIGAVHQTVWRAKASGLVVRYATDPRDVLPAEAVAWQVRRAREILLRLEVPLFFTPGNHDVAFPWGRRAWREHGGVDWDNRAVDYSFDHGDCHFTALDASVQYDERTFERRSVHVGLADRGGSSALPWFGHADRTALEYTLLSGCFSKGGINTHIRHSLVAYSSRMW